MSRTNIDAFELAARPMGIWDRQWFLLSAGDFAAKKFNSMTVSWGSLGVIWGKPFAMCVVRPQRHTFSFMEQYDTFTLCVFPQKYRKMLDVLGTKSGRQMDKINASGLTPEAAIAVASPVYAEAELAIECKKIHFQDFDPKNFIAPYIAPCYNNDYHRMYFGEIVAVTGVDAYRSRAS